MRMSLSMYKTEGRLRQREGKGCTRRRPFQPSTIPRSAHDSQQRWSLEYDDAGSSAESRSTQRLRVATERWSLFSSAFLSGQF